VEGTARKTILLVEEDNDLRPLLRRSLDKDGYDILLAVDEESAMDWVHAASFWFNLILINLVEKGPDEVLRIGRRIRREANRDGDTPVVVMAETFTSDEAGKWFKAGDNDWIVYQEADVLKTLLRQLIPAAA
jgi:DNA-binding response OmpR family regulator